MSDDLCYLTAVEANDLIDRKELSPVELAESILNRIDRLNPILNAFMTVTHDHAMELAREAEKRALLGQRRGTMDGLPFSIKDLDATAGIRTTMGSKWFENDVPLEDNAVAGRLRATGGVLLGKTNTPQWGYKDKGDNLLGPPCLNPWNLEMTPGGSSSGAAAAVTAGLGSLAQGSDGGGSVRIPASLCGIVGFKPSFGRVPDHPSSSYWSAFSHNGPLTRTVRDAALMLQHMAGPDPRDPLTIDSAPDDYVAACEREPAPLRVAISPDLGYAPLLPEVREIFLRAAQRFADFGCNVEFEDPGWSDPGPSFKIFYAVVHAAHHREHATQRPEWMEPSLASLIKDGFSYTGVDLQETSMERSRLYDQATKFFERYDLLLTPTMPVTAWPASSDPTEYPMSINGTSTPHFLDHTPFTYPFNMTGQPAISVPCGFSSAGLPVGMQIVGRWHADSVVLSAAAAFEALQPWTDQKPALSAEIRSMS